MDQRAAEYIQKKISGKPKIGIILGTGLGTIGDQVKDATVIDYREIPGFMASTAPGHAGRLVVGTMGKNPVILMQGRVHYYEGYSMQQLAVPVRTLRRLGVEKLIVTCATGSINASFCPGDTVLLLDHIKLALDSPVRGENPNDLGDRFFDMTTAYTPYLREIAKQAAKATGKTLHEGVYAYMGGPQFETPAEIRALRLLGADLVGMSTVPEVITAAHCGMEVLGLSCVTNMAAGMENGGMNKCVIDEAERRGMKNLCDILLRVVDML